MKLIINFLKVVWTLFFFVNFTFSFFLLFPFFKIALSTKKGYRFAHYLKKIWSLLIFNNTGIRYKIINKGELKKGVPYVYCSNHTSYLDIPLIRLAVPGYFHYIGKKELLKNFFFKIFFQTMDIPVDRNSIISSHRAYLRACKEIDEGVGIIMFPEGTISDKVPKLSEFKQGAFKLAIEKQVPIVPMCLINNWKILPDKNKFLGRPGVVYAIIHEPVITQGMTEHDVDKLKDSIFDLINNTITNFKT